MRSLIPPRGDADTVLGMAAALQRTGDELCAVERTLLRLAASAHWDSPAGRAFQQRVQECPPVLGQIARRCLGAGELLRAHARVLAHELPPAQQAIEQHRIAWEHVDQVQRLLDDAAASAGTALDPPTRAALERRRLEALQEVAAAERRHAQACAALHDSATVLAEGLHGLSQDGLADSVPYRVLTGAGRVAATAAQGLGAVSLVQPELVPVAFAAAGSSVAVDALVALVYGDVTWGEVASGAAVLAVPVVAGYVGKAALVGVPARGVAGPAAPVPLGVRARQGWKTYAASGPWRRPSITVPAGATAVRHAAERSALVRTHRDLRHDWAQASRAGLGVRVVTGSSIVVRGAASARSHANVRPSDQDTSERR